MGGVGEAGNEAVKEAVKRSEQMMQPHLGDSRKSDNRSLHLRTIVPPVTRSAGQQI